MFGRDKHQHHFTGPQNLKGVLCEPQILAAPTYPGVVRYCDCGSVEVTRYDYSMQSGQWGVNSQKIYNASAWADLLLIFPLKKPVTDDLVKRVEASLKEAK